MSDTILSGDFTVFYLDENRQKRIKWTGSSTGTRTMNQLYSALQDHFDETVQMDDGSPMSAQTPVEYTVGSIDSGDLDPWYISFETMEHLTGGALQTSNWTHVDSSTVGIIVVAVASGGSIVTGDESQDISAGTGAGTLLEFIDTGEATDYLVIRPNTDAAADQFTTGSQTITEAGLSHTATQTAAGVSHTGEMIWANLYSIGTIEAKSHIYLYQGLTTDNTRSRVYSIDSTNTDWWPDGHIDICVAIKDYRSTTFAVIDSGNVSVFARKYTTLYDFFEAATSTTSGGRNPIPLATAADLDNTTGHRSVTTTTITSDTYAVGDEILGGSSGARGIITLIAGSSPTYTFHYYPIGEPQTVFQTAAETVDAVSPGTGTGSKDTNAPVDQGPALTTFFTNNVAPSGSFGNVTADIDDDSTDEKYGITIDCNQNPLTEVYEWIKYVTRNGETNFILDDVLEGEQYVGGEVYLEYSGTVSGGTIDEGDDVLQSTTNATGVVISHDTSNKVLLLRNIRGTFNTSFIVTSQDAGAGSVTPDTAAETFSPKKQSPFGTFAGGTFFGARGVLITDNLSADDNKFILTPIEGGTKQKPTSISFTVTNLTGTDETTITDDRVAIFRLTGSGGTINKQEYTAAGGEAIGASTLQVDTTITQDTPGKTVGGVLRIRDTSDNNQEYRIRYDSYATDTFTLSNIVVTAEAGTDTDTIVDTGLFGGAKRGDLVLNTTRSDAISYITSVDDANTIQISPAISGQTTGDAIEINAIPVVIASSDDVFVPLIDTYASAGTASSSVVFSSQIFFRTVVRNVANSTPILPFSTDGNTNGTDVSVATIRTTDTIFV